MNIRINGVEIDFRLEEERTAGDVCTGVAQWLRETGHRVESVSLNGSPVSDDEADWESRPVEEVTDMDFVAESLRERQVNEIDTIINYAGLLRRVMLEGSPEQRNAVLEELPHVVEGIRRNAPDLVGLLEEPLQEQSHDDEGVRERAARRADEIAGILESRQREILDPAHEMGATITALDGVLSTFEEIAGQLQDGDRKSALDRITRFSELVSRELRILPMLMSIKPGLRDEVIQEEQLDAAVQSLNDLFREMEGAFTNGDFVLIGDLLEYEMLPRFSELHQVVRRYC
jgi:hypothetical protein